MTPLNSHCRCCDFVDYLERLIGDQRDIVRFMDDIALATSEEERYQLRFTPNDLDLLGTLLTMRLNEIEERYEHAMNKIKPRSVA